MKIIKSEQQMMRYRVNKINMDINFFPINVGKTIGRKYLINIQDTVISQLSYMKKLNELVRWGNP